MYESGEKGESYSTMTELNDPTVRVLTELHPEVIFLFFDRVHGVYDPETQDTAIGMVDHENPADKTAEVINHEYLHYILHKEENLDTSIALDNIDGRENSLYREFQ